MNPLSDNAQSLVDTFAANVNNSKLSDSEFRDFIRNSLTTNVSAIAVLDRFAIEQQVAKETVQEDELILQHFWYAPERDLGYNNYSGQIDTAYISGEIVRYNIKREVREDDDEESPLSGTSYKKIEYLGMGYIHSLDGSMVKCSPIYDEVMDGTHK